MSNDVTDNKTAPTKRAPKASDELNELRKEVERTRSGGDRHVEYRAGHRAEANTVLGLIDYRIAAAERAEAEACIDDTCSRGRLMLVKRQIQGLSAISAEGVGVRAAASSLCEAEAKRADVEAERVPVEVPLLEACDLLSSWLRAHGYEEDRQSLQSMTMIRAAIETAVEAQDSGAFEVREGLDRIAVYGKPSPPAPDVEGLSLGLIAQCARLQPGFIDIRYFGIPADEAFDTYAATAKPWNEGGIAAYSGLCHSEESALLALRDKLRAAQEPEVEEMPDFEAMSWEELEALLPEKASVDVARVAYLNMDAPRRYVVRTGSMAVDSKGPVADTRIAAVRAFLQSEWEKSQRNHGGAT